MKNISGKEDKKEGDKEEKKDDGEMWCKVEEKEEFMGKKLWEKKIK
jgi:hypothetical protein